MWTAENSPTILFTASLTSVSLDTSQCTGRARQPLLAIAAAVASAALASRSTQATAAPASAKASEIARPIPLPAPVTTADFPASEQLSVTIIASPTKRRQPQFGQDRPPERADSV